MKTRLSMIAACAAVVSILVAPAAHAAPAEPDYVRTAYDGAIYEVTDEDARALSYDEWAQLGFPAFVTASTEYQKVLSFPTVSAVTGFDRPGIELTQAITWEGYRAAGFPAITTLAWGPDISVHKWGTSDELIAQDAVGDTLKLSYPQWRDAGFPAYTAREGRGFVRLSWDASGGIAYLCDTAAGKGGRLTYDQWTSLGSPTPLAVTRTANDAVWRIVPRSGGLSYVGAMNLDYDPSSGLQPGMKNRNLSYQEWVGMGSPAPVDSIPAASWSLSCGGDSLTAWE